MLKLNISYHFSFLLLLVVACSEQTKEMDLSNYINKIKMRPATPIKPLPNFAPLPQFTFPAQDDERRSPFKALVHQHQQVQDTFAPNQQRPRQPLEAFPLDALKFVGILRQGATIWALISQPDGQISRVRPRNYMGKNFGKVISVQNDQIKIEETIKNSGKWEKKITAFNLNVRNGE